MNTEERKTGIYSIKEKENKSGGGLEWDQDSLKFDRGVGGDEAQRAFLKETASGLAFKEQAETRAGPPG